MPVIRGECEEVSDCIFSDVSYHASAEPMRSVRTKRYNYIRRFSDRRTPVRPHIDDSPSKPFWIEQGWTDRDVDQEALFDCTFDPLEMHTLADEQRMGDVLSDMRTQLGEWMKRTNDPLLTGTLPIVKGSKINDPDDISGKRPPKVMG